MTRAVSQISLLAIGVGLLMAMCGQALAETVSPFDVGDRAQLFVDKVLVRSAENVAFTLHPAEKHPDNPLLKAEKPWEGWRLEIYGSVLYDEDEKIFKMWYIGEAHDYYPSYATFIATSKDGIHWEKPLIGTVPDAKGNQTNAVIDQCVLASVIKDNEDPDPARRYKAIVWLQRTAGYHTMISPDGLHWTQLSKKPICRSGDVITGYYDRARKLYVAFPKIGARIRGHNRRVFWLITSKDFETWTEPKLVIYPDLRDDAGSLARIEEGWSSTRTCVMMRARWRGSRRCAQSSTGRTIRTSCALSFMGWASTRRRAAPWRSRGSLPSTTTPAGATRRGQSNCNWPSQETSNTGSAHSVSLVFPAAGSASGTAAYKRQRQRRFG